MKKFTIGVIAGLAMIFSTSAAHAFGVSVDVPFEYKFDIDGTKADSVSGYLLAVKLPVIFLGFGLESYTAAVNDVSGTFKSKFNFQIVDFFINLPIPVVNIGVGLGLGTVKGEDDPIQNVSGVDITYDSGAVFQYYVTLGYNIIPLLDLHLGYHVVDASVAMAGGATGDIDLAGKMLSLGVTLGF